MMIMNTKDFISKFAEAIDAEAPEELVVSTQFRKLGEWNSLAVLSVIVLLDEEYGVQIESAQFKQLQTIGDIISYIESNQ